MSDTRFGVFCFLAVMILLVVIVLMAVPFENKEDDLKAFIYIPGYDAPVVVRVQSWTHRGSVYRITSTDGTVYRADQINVLLVEEGGE